MFNSIFTKIKLLVIGYWLLVIIKSKSSGYVFPGYAWEQNKEPGNKKTTWCKISGITEILHHSQLAVGAGSPTALKLVDRLYKPARPHEKSP
jgi:hypothetical protein